MKKLETLGKSLSKQQQKNIVGGDDPIASCCWHTSGWTQYDCNMTRTDAEATATAYALLSGNHGYWCCTSCAQP